MPTKKEISGWFGYDEDETIHVEIDDARIVYACYRQEGYEGDCVVIFVKDSKWFWVNTGHCSCNENSWEPQETTPEKLLAHYDTKRDSEIADAIRAAS